MVTGGFYHSQGGGNESSTKEVLIILFFLVTSGNQFKKKMTCRESTTLIHADLEQFCCCETKRRIQLSGWQLYPPTG